MLGTHLAHNVHLVHFEPGRIELRLTDKAPAKLPNDLGAHLSDWTGRRWVVSVSQEDGAPTLAEQNASQVRGRVAWAEEDPLVKAVLETFPGAVIKEVRDVSLDTGDPNAGADEDNPQGEDDA